MEDVAHTRLGGAVDFATLSGSFQEGSGYATVFGKEGGVAGGLALAELLQRLDEGELCILSALM